MKPLVFARRSRPAVFSPRGLAASAVPTLATSPIPTAGDPSPRCRAASPASVASLPAAAGTTRITLSFDVPHAELAAHLNACALLDILHARRRRELGSILGGALRGLVPHYAHYSIAPASATADLRAA